MSEPKNGGPAFPVPGFPGDANYTLPFPGMTLRQYYAGQALAGIMANQSYYSLPRERIAAMCADQADVLIDELEKGSE